MAYYEWVITGPAASINTVTRSFNYSVGRRSPDDIAATTIGSITLKNANESTFPLTINDEVTFSFRIGLTDYAQITGRVASMDYLDEPGTGIDSSVTVTLFNALGLQSLEELSAASISAGTIAQQITTLNTLTTLDTNYSPFGGTSSYNMAAQTYTGSSTDYVRTLANADNAIIQCSSKTNINYFSYDYGFINPGVTVGRSATATQLGYSDIRRRRFQKPFYNQVTVSSNAVAAQTATNASSVAAYGKKAFNLDTFYSTTAQAADAASWYSNAWSSDAFSFEVDFVVEAQDEDVWTQAGTTTTAGIANITTFAGCLFGAFPTYLTVSYIAPGAASATTVPCILEGVTINATPSSTTGTIYLTPVTFYSRFILDNTLFGILDTDRLGW